ncbi:MAG TPA: hypothetical protein VK187_03390 [Geobacteraceae bacterium]|nr:hypothetical protein [Geobacteraceae bacterium]
MDPTYATYDPLQLTYLENGMVTDQRAMADPIARAIPIPPRGGGAVRSFGAYGQMDTVSPDQVFQDTGIVAAPQPGVLDAIGGALSNIIRTIGQQAPGIITGQPLPGQAYPGYYPTTTTGIPPLLLIGGIVLVGYFLLRKK